MKALSLPLLVFIFFSSLYAVTASGHYGGDGYLIFLTARSIVLDGDLSINDRPLGIKEMEKTSKTMAAAGKDGRQYSKYGIGLAIAEVPLVATGAVISRLFPSIDQDYFLMLAASFTNCFITALLCLVIFLFARRLGYGDRISLLLTFAFGFSSFAWPYSRLSMTEPAQALALMSSFYFAYRFKHEEDIKMLAYSGIAIGTAVAVKSYLIVILPMAFFYLLPDFLSAQERWKRIFTYLTPPTIIVSGILLLNKLTIGGFLSNGYDSSTKILPFEFLQNIYGLTLSSGKSFFLYFPAALIGAIFWKYFHEKHRAESLLFLVIIFSQLFFFSFFSMGGFAWHGDITWGPRYIYILLPFFALALGGYLTQLSNKGVRPAAFFSAVAAGVIIQLPAVLMRMADYVQLVKDYRMEDLHFVPILSPVLGGWLQVASLVKRLLTGRSLEVIYRIGSGVHDNRYEMIKTSFHGYDRLDLWFTTALSRFGGNTGITAAIILIVALLAALSLISFYAVIRLATVGGFNWSQPSNR